MVIDEQKNILAQTFGCVRFLNNFGLHARSVAYKEQGKKLNYHDLAALISSRTCATDVALAIGAVPGRAISQARATCEGVTLRAYAMLSTAFRVLKPRSFIYLP